MLKALFSSNTRVKLLTIYLTGEGNEYFIRELTRLLKEQINSIRRELNNLKKVGLLKCRTRNRKKYYYINEDFLLLEDLRAIIAKCTDPRKELARKIQKLGKVDLVHFSGVFVKRKTTIDVLIVGDIEKNILDDFFKSEVKEIKEVKYALLSREDFLYRVKLNDKFIIDMLKDPDNILALNKLKGPLSKVLS
jgi:predicted transcriptional regulator